MSKVWMAVIGLWRLQQSLWMMLMLIVVVVVFDVVASIATVEPSPLVIIMMTFIPLFAWAHVLLLLLDVHATVGITLSFDQ